MCVLPGCCWLKGAFEVGASERDGERSGVLLRIYNPERPPALIMHGYTAPRPSRSSNLEEGEEAMHSEAPPALHCAG